MATLLLNVDAKDRERTEKTEFFGRAGFEVLEAATEAEALELAGVRRPALAVVSTRLPQIDGYRLGRQLKAQHDNGGPLVLLVAPAFEGLTPDLDMVADAYLAAPPYYPALLAQVRLLVKLGSATADRQRTESDLDAERSRTSETLAERTIQATALAASEERLRVALTATRLGTWEWTEPKDEIQIDRRTAELYDIPIGQPVTWQWLLANRVHPDDRADTVARVRASANGDGWYRATHRVVHSTGDVLWVQASGQMLFGDPADSSRVTRLVGSTEDVTAAKRTERALRQSEGRLRELIEALPLLVWSCEPGGACDYLSPQWMRYTGVEAQHGLGTGWVAQVHPDDRARVQLAWQSTVDAEEPFGCEFRIRGADGDYRWFDTRAVPIRDADGHLVKWLGMNLDVDQAKRAQEALRDADRRKDEFLAMLAHELRNPLAPIRNSVALLRRQPDPDSITRRAHDIIDRQVSHLARLVDDLLDVSRITQGKVRLMLAPISLGTAIEQAIETTRPYLESRRIGLVASLGPDPMPVMGDLLRLVQCVANLLDNAAKFTPEGRTIAISGAVEDGQAVVRVKDPGVGIPADLLPHIFGLFTQGDAKLDRSQGGLGIGLTIVKAIVELHGGEVSAASAGQDQGSEFVFRLPIATPAAIDPVAAAAGLAAPNGRIRVLLVDDNQDAALSLALLLELQGFQVRTAADGPTAVQLAVEFDPAVALLDIGLPGMDGYEVATRLRSDPRTSRIQLIAITGYGRDQDRDRATASGFDHHLVKPVDPDAVQVIISGSAAAEIL